MKRISTAVPLAKWEALPRGASFAVTTDEGLRVNLSRRGDTLVAEAEAVTQAVTEERLWQHETAETASSARQTTPRHDLWGGAALVLFVGMGIILWIRRRT